MSITEQLTANSMLIDKGVIEYVEQEILPLYEGFDRAHSTDHVTAVVERSLALATHYPVNYSMVYAIAAYHDIGLPEGRELHHINSARLLREDERLREWFSESEIEVMAEAVEDHRASSDHAPRSIYGRIVAEADRLIDGDLVMRRTVQYGLAHYPELSPEGHWNRFCAHLDEKYAEGGYLRLWIPESDNARRLAELRQTIANPTLLRESFDRIFAEETANS